MGCVPSHGERAYRKMIPGEPVKYSRFFLGLAIATLLTIIGFSYIAEKAIP